MSKLLRGLMAMVVLASGAAFADPAHVATPVRGHHERERRDQREHREWVHRDGRYEYGHYENRLTQVWVPARWVSVQVPNCVRGRFERFVCHSYHLEQRFVPGHFESRTQVVWVNETRVHYGVSYTYVAPPSFVVTAQF